MTIIRAGFVLGFGSEERVSHTSCWLIRLPPVFSPPRRKDADGSLRFSGGSRWDRGAITRGVIQEQKKKNEGQRSHHLPDAPHPVALHSAPREPTSGPRRLWVLLAPTSRCAGLLRGRGEAGASSPASAGPSLCPFLQTGVSRTALRSVADLPGSG